MFAGCLSYAIYQFWLVSLKVLFFHTQAHTAWKEELTVDNAASNVIAKMLIHSILSKVFSRIMYK